MAEPTSPVAEAIERLGDAATTNTAEAVACAVEWAAALGAATGPTPAGAPIADAFARAVASAWLATARSTAVAAAAITDAAAIMAHPPQLVDRHSIDLAELFPGRTQPITLEIQHVSWVTTPSPPVDAPAVTTTDAQPIAPPATGAPDTATVAVRPATLHALAVRIRFVRIATKPSAPVEVTVRISPTTMLLDPAPGGISP